jgi:hypothetical protein
MSAQLVHVSVLEIYVSRAAVQRIFIAHLIQQKGRRASDIFNNWRVFSVIYTQASSYGSGISNITSLVSDYLTF